MIMDSEKIEVNMLPVNEGDCLHIRFLSGGEWRNIVIDSGPSACASQFCLLLNQIRNKQEHVDLLCFSHIDDDHIKGAEMTFSEPSFDSSHIKLIWVNLPDSITSSDMSDQVSAYENITVESAYKIYSHIIARNIPCSTKVTAGDQITIGNIPITAILPTPQRLASYYRRFEKDLNQLRHSKPFLFISGTTGDTNPYNGSSLSLMLSTASGKMLLSGDAFASDLATAARNYALDDGFLLVKLPHHGSDRNVNEDLLEALKCQNYLISTHSTTYRPAQNTINLLANYGKTHDTVTLYGNYEWPFIQKPDQGIKIMKLPGSGYPITIGEVTIYSEG